MAKTKTKKPVHSQRYRVISEALGWYGAAAILTAYVLASFNVVTVHDTGYLILNFTGAIGVLTVATAKHVRQSMLVNAFWAAMAGLALIKIILQV